MSAFLRKFPRHRRPPRQDSDLHRRGRCCAQPGGVAYLPALAHSPLASHLARLRSHSLADVAGRRPKASARLSPRFWKDPAGSPANTSRTAAIRTAVLRPTAEIFRQPLPVKRRPPPACASRPQDGDRTHARRLVGTATTAQLRL